MKIIKKMLKEELFWVGMVTFIGLPYFAAFLLRRSKDGVESEIFFSLVIYILVFFWIMNEGVSRSQKQKR